MSAHWFPPVAHDAVPLTTGLATHPCRCPGNDSHTGKRRSPPRLRPRRVLGLGARYLFNRYRRLELKGPGHKRLKPRIDQAAEVVVDAQPSVHRVDVNNCALRVIAHGDVIIEIDQVSECLRAEGNFGSRRFFFS